MHIDIPAIDKPAINKNEQFRLTDGTAHKSCELVFDRNGQSPGVPTSLSASDFI